MLNKMKKGEKYYSFYDNIRHYQIEKLHLLRNEEKYDKIRVKSRDKKFGDYQKKDPFVVKHEKERNRLFQARKRIKERIEESLDGALSLVLIPPMLFYSPKNSPMNTRHVFLDFSKHENLDENNNMISLASDPFLFDSVINDNEKVKDKLLSHRDEFLVELFSPERIEKLLSAIFSHIDPHKTHELEYEKREYFITIAKLMARESLTYIHNQMDESYAKLLQEDLKRAIAICNIVTPKKIN